MITVLLDIFESDRTSGRFHLGADSGRLWAFRCHLRGSAMEKQRNTRPGRV